MHDIAATYRGLELERFRFLENVFVLWLRPILAEAIASKTPGKVVGPRDRTPSLESCEATQQAAGQLLLHWLRQCHPQPFLAALPILGCELPDWGAVWLVRTPLQVISRRPSWPEGEPVG